MHTCMGMQACTRTHTYTCVHIYTNMSNTLSATLTMDPKKDRWRQDKFMAVKWGAKETQGEYSKTAVIWEPMRLSRETSKTRRTRWKTVPHPPPQRSSLGLSKSEKVNRRLNTWTSWSTNIQSRTTFHKSLSRACW